MANQLSKRDTEEYEWVPPRMRIRTKEYEERLRHIEAADLLESFLNTRKSNAFE